MLINEKVGIVNLGAEGMMLCAAIAGFATVVQQSLQSAWMHRAGTRGEQTAAILFLASSEASYITGTTLPVAGGDQG